MVKQKTILVAPLHWGLGHATRCIPIIKALIKYNFNVIIASDGAALWLLQKEFPKLLSIELPSYNIRYPKNKNFFLWRMFLQVPKILKVISSEKKIIRKLIYERKIDGIISDNRFGIRSINVPSVYITHQLKVLMGPATFISSKIHQRIIKKFDECWIPDSEGSHNLSGELGHLIKTKLNIKYMGPLSRMKRILLPKKHDFLILLSGPEPHRSLLEERMIRVFKDLDQKILLVRGVVENKQLKTYIKKIEIVNFLLSNELESAINESELVISRSGYTTIMDLTALEKKAFFIPTPGQPEQEYLAKRLKNLEIVPSCNEDDFTFKKLDDISMYKGLLKNNTSVNFEKLFSFF